MMQQKLPPASKFTLYIHLRLNRDYGKSTRPLANPPLTYKHFNQESHDSTWMPWKLGWMQQRKTDTKLIHRTGNISLDQLIFKCTRINAPTKLQCIKNIQSFMYSIPLGRWNNYTSYAWQYKIYEKIQNMGCHSEIAVPLLFR
jgi:hypothetical protein